MYFQRVVNGELVGNLVAHKQVPTGDETYFPVGDMQPPVYDPHKQTFFDEGIELDAEGLPFWHWSLLPFPEIELDIWAETAGRAKLELHQSEAEASNDLWAEYRATLQDILNNAELDEPVGTPEDVVWPVKPE